MNDTLTLYVISEHRGAVELRAVEVRETAKQYRAADRFGGGGAWGYRSTIAKTDPCVHHTPAEAWATYIASQQSSVQYDRDALALEEAKLASAIEQAATVPA